MYHSHWHGRSMQRIRYIIICILPTWYWYAYTVIPAYSPRLETDDAYLSMKTATGENCFPLSPSCQTVIHHSYPNITGCVEGCPYPFSRQSALATMGFRVDCCSTRDAAAMAEENPDLHGFTVHWPVPTKCCRGSILFFFSYVFVFGFRRSTLEFGIPWPCRSDDSDSILWPCRLAILWIEVVILT